ncbi:MAG TPA: GAF domain-containing SpoIIE family protein phosphatase [Solirubrobacterales bacterium]|jgi:serine phosphatase RsbU (regulator of sigma subunit)|nr:GAF domain-containing SpoIIE family protein phosphatase [Solirubrobacterales bacterium]
MHTIVIAGFAFVLAIAVIVLSRSLVGTRRMVHRFRILSEIAEVSEDGGTPVDVLHAIGDVLVPGVADICLIDMISEGEVERVVVRVAPDADAEAASVLARRKPSIPEEMTLRHLPQAPPKLRFLERMGDAELRELAHDPEDLEFLRSLAARSAITVALRARGQLTGALTLVTSCSGRDYSRDDVRFAKVLAGRVALALDNAGLFTHLERAERATAEIARTLQRGLIPPPLPHIPGWSTAALYRPAGAENEVGGDFYDVFPIVGGWMVVIGDVTGRGARAASVTAQARYTLRTAGVLSGDPVTALETLNRALLVREDSALCSLAALALSDNHGSRVQMAVAGHPPPLLVDGDVVAEAAPVGPVLGAFPDARWSVEEVVLSVGQQLVAVTDGITEAAGLGGRFGEERLHMELASVSSPAVAVQKLEGAVHEFTQGKFEDDAAILAVAPAPSQIGAEAPITAVSAFPPPPEAPTIRRVHG